MCRVQDLVCFMTMPIGFSNDNLCYGFRGGGNAQVYVSLWSMEYLVSCMPILHISGIL